MKRGFPRGLMVVLFALVLLVGGVVFLAVVDVAPPAAPYEHALDLRAVAKPAAVSAPVTAAPTAPAAAPSGAE